MLFNSLHFLLFFPIVTILYFLLGKNSRVGLLLLASCYFYMVFKPVYILILFLLIAIDYFAGIYIGNAQGHKRKVFLIISLVANISMLCIFKYFSFIVENLERLLHLFDVTADFPQLSILLPIGLSFHTFQSMSYTIEVYRGNQKPEKNVALFALYVLFYPQLVAGPIERPQNLLHQFHKKQAFNYEGVVDGLRRMLWGFFKKVVIADKLALLVNYIYSDSSHYNGTLLLISTLFFTFQIYCDFSGYSDIALGAARIMGYDLMQNFNAPYLSKSITEFWRRWHISLSTWFRDYLYISLGGNRVSIFRTFLNIFIVFMVSGLWHGPNWTFVIWGSLHGLFLISERVHGMYIKNKFSFLPKIPSLISGVITFILVMFAWIFFRASSVGIATGMIKKILFNFIPSDGLRPILSTIASLTGDPAYFLKCIFYILLLLVSEYTFGANVLSNVSIRFRSRKIRWAIYYILIFILFFSNNAQQTFIYFQF